MEGGRSRVGAESIFGCEFLLDLGSLFLSEWVVEISSNGTILEILDLRWCLWRDC
jgi:hypothetical protein